MSVDDSHRFATPTEPYNPTVTDHPQRQAGKPTSTDPYDPTTAGNRPAAQREEQH